MKQKTLKIFEERKRSRMKIIVKWLYFWEE
jgi:hypothetical protein